MVLSDQDREWIKLIAKDIAFEAIKETLSQHISSCPFGKKLLFGKAFLIGACATVGVLASSFGFGLAKVVAMF